MLWLAELIGQTELVEVRPNQQVRLPTPIIPVKPLKPLSHSTLTRGANTSVIPRKRESILTLGNRRGELSYCSTAYRAARSVIYAKPGSI